MQYIYVTCHWQKAHLFLVLTRFSVNNISFLPKGISAVIWSQSEKSDDPGAHLIHDNFERSHTRIGLSCKNFVQPSSFWFDRLTAASDFLKTGDEPRMDMCIALQISQEQGANGHIVKV